MGTQDDDAGLSKLAQVPNLYAGRPNEMELLQADAITLVFAMVFGAVHSSIALVGAPAIYVFLLVLWAFALEAAVKFY
ncbi:hypothetical protein FIBSPDRAFT_953093 [Athelia psychrophila]|uniref:Uncharacterized protein n=1 Tax=Athelia psychrophila TaxID=1759441 RepID=A0A166KU23_9AGAM|nr:hypothetical protein FIBSPDRAFT_953093 [Fibularhizoctonia sp. CBS 109695]